MNFTSFVTLAFLGGIGGFAAGFLGVGGGVLLFPLLLYIPPLLGIESLDVKSAAALVVSQVFFASLIGGTAHWRSGRVHGKLTLVAAAAAMASSFFGGVASKWASESFLLLLFGVVTLIAAAIMLLPVSSRDRDEIPLERLVVPLLPVALLSLAIGAVVGFIGAGNFVFVPLLIYLLKVPTRVAIGSNLVIAVLSSLSGFLGKILTGQIAFFMTLTVVIGAGLGALGGEWSHSRVSPRVLRYVYATVVGTVTATVWISILQ